VDIRTYFQVHWHPCGGSGRTASSVQVYARNNLRAAEQIFMKFGTGKIYGKLLSSYSFLLGRLAILADT